MKTKKEKIEIILLPSDFIDGEYGDISDCPVARAAKRHFKTNDLSVGSRELVLFKPFIEFYKIINTFSPEDYYYVKKQYSKDPEMKKTCYVVTLEKI